MKTKIKEHAESLAVIITIIASVMTSTMWINGKFNDIDIRFSKIENRFINIDAQIINIEKEIDNRFSHLETHFNQIENRFTQIEKDVAVIKTVLLMKNIMPSELVWIEKNGDLANKNP